MWNLKYYSEWEDIKGNDNRIEIHSHELGETKKIYIENFSITYPNFDLFSDKAVYGCGADIVLNSEFELDYKDSLYTINPKGLFFKHFMNGSLNFIGYLDSEQYHDNFYQSVNYSFSISANNGISILDRIKISDNSNNELSGIYNALDVIKFALNKLDISYDKLYLGVSTEVDNNNEDLPVLFDDATILHKLNVKSANYVDEKGNWMSCREVINSILLPLTLKMYIEKDNIYIVDINKLAKEDNLILKEYNFSDLSYIQDVSLNNVNDINMSVNNNTLNKQSGVNKIDVKFNKYIYEVPFKFELDNNSFDNMYSEQSITNSEDITFIEKKYTISNNFEIVDNKGEFVSLQDTSEANKTDYFIRLSGNTDNQYTEVKPSLKLNTGIYPTSSRNIIKLNCDFMVEDVNDINVEYTFNEIAYNFLYRFRLGNKIIGTWNEWKTDWGSTNGTDGQPFKLVKVMDYEGAVKFPINKYLNIEDNISNAWADGSLNVLQAQLNNDLAESTESIEGDKELIIEFIAHNPIVLSPDNEGANKNLTLRIKNVEVVWMAKDEFGNQYEVSNNDEEYQGKIDENYINDLSIETKHGTDIEGNSRGMFLIKLSGNYSDSDYATNERLVNLNSVTREGNTGTTEELLLNTYFSNLQESRYLYSTTLLDYYSIIDRFTYKLYRDSIQCKLLPVAMTKNYITAETSVKLLEIVKDESIT